VNVHQAFKYIYTGLGSWHKEDGYVGTARAGNAKLADMQSVTPRSLAYIASLVCGTLMHAPLSLLIRTHCISDPHCLI
jgi:Family of unknown function (DUF6698)